MNLRIVWILCDSHAADLQDREGAKLVLGKLKDCFAHLQLIWADGAYTGQLLTWAYAWDSLICRAGPALGGGTHFGWLGRHPRLAKDYDALPATSEALNLYCYDLSYAP